MILSDYKSILKSRCNNRFSESEIYEFWKWFDENLNKIEDESIKAEKFNHWLEELILEKPIQYIFGYAYFHKYVFDVNENTLIPRPETEELCERIIQWNEGKLNLKGIDIGTGSGCIPVTLLCESLTWEFDALDISENALKVAAQNGSKYNVNKRLTLTQKDFFSIITSSSNQLKISRFFLIQIF